MADNRKLISYWKKSIERYERSGLTKSSYCRQSGINLGQFNYWRKKMEKGSSEESLSFKEIQIKALPSPVRIRIIYSHGVQMEVEGSVSAAYIRQLAGC